MLLLIKYIPVMQMAGMLVNNTMYYFNISSTFSYGLDFLLGGSFITILLLYVCSYVFEFCQKILKNYLLKL